MSPRALASARRTLAAIGLALLGAAPLGSCGGPSRDVDPGLLRIGVFPNVTHAQGLIARHRSRAAKGGSLEERLGVRIEWFAFQAGPSAMEALRAGSLDATYVGPSPALNTYVKSGGAEVRVLAGAARGGSALVVQGDGRISTPADFRGRLVATPQIGNTQDVACRGWLVKNGFHVTLRGGDVSVKGVANPDILTLFKKGDLDAAWTVEPWVARLETEAGGKVLVEEPDAITTILVGSARLVADRPALAKALVAANAELTAWIAEHGEEARAEVRAALEEETKAKVSPELVARSWARVRFDAAISREPLDAFVRAAQGVGFLPDAIPLDRLMAAP